MNFLAIKVLLILQELCFHQVNDDSMTVSFFQKNVSTLTDTSVLIEKQKQTKTNTITAHYISPAITCKLDVFI